MTASMVIVDARMAVVTDLGRARGPQFGLPVNGALDQSSARIANILTGNDENAPLIEVTAFDFACTADTDILIAVTGAEMTLRVDGVVRSMWEPVPVSAGQTVRLTNMTAGVRSYLAVRGAFDVPRLLGSCAPDTVIGFGTMLSAGMHVALARPTASPVNPFFGVSLFHLGVPRPAFGGTAVIEVTDGPDIAEFAGTADRLFENTFRVTPKSNHIGLRMTGELPVRLHTAEMISRGVPVGAIEVPPGDELLVLHRGRGVTAGYPVLGVVTSSSLDTLGQIRPGQSVAFRKVDVDQASRTTRSQRAILDTLRERVTTVFSCLAADDPAAIRLERSPPC